MSDSTTFGSWLLLSSFSTWMINYLHFFVFCADDALICLLMRVFSKCSTEPYDLLDENLLWGTIRLSCSE
jgi:hypothetical protein